jgi:hypothetical protein
VGRIRLASETATDKLLNLETYRGALWQALNLCCVIHVSLKRRGFLDTYASILLYQMNLNVSPFINSFQAIKEEDATQY